ncbi:uncharacterized protein QC763_511852 [Podospora pseudopauciseta]|uniref:ACB domain-containing protein n=1 Tax=Podospora pseudopauciseta TaxID=2093780 RepID=A0ABR0H960_9PEZI|nr:hypothetical protein QC763_511852 [Podospora pseudopauciseta]
MSVDTQDKCAESTRPFAAESLSADHPDHNDASSDSAEDVLELVSNTLDIGHKPSPELIKKYQLYMVYNVDRVCDTGDVEELKIEKDMASVLAKLLRDGVEKVEEKLEEFGLYWR